MLSYDESNMIEQNQRGKIIVDQCTNVFLVILIIIIYKYINHI